MDCSLSLRSSVITVGPLLLVCAFPGHHFFQESCSILYIAIIFTTVTLLFVQLHQHLLQQTHNAGKIYAFLEHMEMHAREHVINTTLLEQTKVHLALHPISDSCHPDASGKSRSGTCG